MFLLSVKMTFSSILEMQRREWPETLNTYLVEDVLKVSGALLGQGQPIVIPRLSDKIDYEGELAVIIGKRGKDIAENNALSSAFSSRLSFAVGAISPAIP